MISYGWITLDGVLDDFENTGWLYICDGDVVSATPVHVEDEE